MVPETTPPTPVVGNKVDQLGFTFWIPWDLTCGPIMGSNLSPRGRAPRAGAKRGTQPGDAPGQVQARVGRPLWSGGPVMTRTAMQS